MKVAVYCRLSEEDKNKQMKTDDSESIQNQKLMLFQYAMDQGWEIYGIYSDDDYTGADRNRPQFNRLLEDAKQHEFDIILCKTQSRFTRELELVEKYIHGLFPVWGIRFVSIVDNADTDNKGNKKSRQINGLVNEWYLEDMSDNIKCVLTNKRRNGMHIGAFALYGYKKDPHQKGHLIMDEEAAKVVREVFTLFSEGYGKTAIARILNERGVPNPTEYKRQKGLHYKQSKQMNSTLWKYSSISSMLKNEIYLGHMVQGKYGSESYKTKKNRPRPKERWYRVEGTHEPIIEKELWYRVQELIERRSKPFSTGKIGLFAKKVRCANCGSIMCSSKNQNRYYLQCPRHRIAREACIGSFISVERLEEAVLRELNVLTETYLEKKEVEEKTVLYCDWEKEKLALKKEMETCQEKVNLFTKGIRELYIDKIKGVISEKDYIELIQNFSSEKECLEELISQQQTELLELEEKIRGGENRLLRIMKYLNPERLSREYIETMLDYILVDKRISGSCEVPIEIHWNF